MGTHRSRESLRLTSDSQSAKHETCSKIPGFEHAYRRRTNAARHHVHDARPALPAASRPVGL